MTSKRWSPSEVEKLRQQAAVMTMNELAELHELPYSTLYSVCNRNGIKALSEKPRWSREVKSFILENTHLSCQELAKATGCNQDSIRHLLCDVYGPHWRRFMKGDLSREE